MRARRVLLIGVLGLWALPVLAVPASAHPSRETLAVACDNGHGYTFDLNGNGEFTSARVVGSTAVFVPHAFSAVVVELRDDQGVLVDTFTEPAGVKGSGKQKGDITCTYSFLFTSDGSEGGPPAGYTFSGTGTATGRLTPRG